MTKADLIQEVARAAELTIKDAEAIVNEIFQAMIDSLKKGDEIELRGFGTFRQRERRARRGRNPKTGQAVEIPPKRVTYFKLGKELKSLLAKSDSQVEQAAGVAADTND